MERTPKQRLSAIRNWQKLRLTGFTLDIEGLSPEEKGMYNSMRALQKTMLDNWSKNSILHFKITPKLYRCWCGAGTDIKRVSKHHFWNKKEVYLCKKHAKEEQENV